jgi:hypothetical protein
MKTFRKISDILISMKKYTQSRFLQSLFKNIQLQLFISFISLPFLISWGLPISLVMPVSTLIFGPFLTCFLLISSLIFFLELLYIPNTLFIWCLEQVTNIWLACLNLEQRAWLVGFQKPPLLILCCIPFIALALVHSKKIITIPMRTGLLALLLITTCGALKLFPYAQYNAITKIPCNKGELTLINPTSLSVHPDPSTMLRSKRAPARQPVLCSFSERGSLGGGWLEGRRAQLPIIVIDPGYMASRPNYESFIAYTLIPEIVQKTGSTQIDHLIVSKLNKRILDAVQFLATKMIIKNVYIPAWKGKIPPFAWRSYIALKKTMLAENGKIHSISYKKQLKHDVDYTVSIEPSQTKDICYYDATYKPLCINGIIDAKTFSL